jgi:plasmid stabilization system protein ParE
MIVVWSPDALECVDEISSYWSALSPRYAEKSVKRMRDLVDHLEVHPELGLRCTTDGLRKLIVGGTPFIIFYDLMSDRIEIVAVVDGRRELPET